MPYFRNNVDLIGNVVKDPTVKTLDNGTPAARFRLATTESWTDDAGQKQERSQFHLCIAFGKTAELTGKYVHAGDHVAVQGSLQHREYEQDGQKRYVTEVKVNEIGFLKAKAQPA